MDESRLSGGGGGIDVGPLLAAGDRDSKLRGLPNVGGAAAEPQYDGVTLRESESGVLVTSALRRKSIASGAEVADDEVSGGGVVAVVGVPAVHSRFSEDDGGGGGGG